MRKGITSSVFILLFTFVSGSVFAGDKSECDIYKKSEDYKGAYGLCVAYQNADEAGRADIFVRWNRKFGPEAPILPNSPNDVDGALPCPCWDADGMAVALQDLVDSRACPGLSGPELFVMLDPNDDFSGADLMNINSAQSFFLLVGKDSFFTNNENRCMAMAPAHVDLVFSPSTLLDETTEGSCREDVIDFIAIAQSLPMGCDEQ